MAALQFSVANMLVAGRIITFPDDCRLVTARIQVAVDTVVTGIQYTIFKPADVEIRLVEGNVLGGSRELDPVQSSGGFSPERHVVFNGLPVSTFVLCFIEVGVTLERFGYGIAVAHVDNPY
jgi:hypothetical protein